MAVLQRRVGENYLPEIVTKMHYAHRGSASK
jgi:hypothetical protein